MFSDSRTNASVLFCPIIRLYHTSSSKVEVLANFPHLFEGRINAFEFGTYCLHVLMFSMDVVGPPSRKEVLLKVCDIVCASILYFQL